jgi:hypothetical protein
VNVIKSLHAVGVFCLVALAAQASRAQLINLNFTSAAYDGTGETSPATPSGPAGTWNSLTTPSSLDPGSWETDSAAVLLSDGSPGPTLTFDTTSGSGALNNWGGTALTLQTIDYTTAGGVYDVANLYETGLRNNGNATTGFRVKGLAPGTYEVFVIPTFRNAQPAGEKADAAVTFSIGLGNTTDARDVGDHTLTSTDKSVTQNFSTTLTSWVAATDGSTAYNYIGATVTIDSTDRWLTILMGDSATPGPDRPGPSVIQIRAGSTQPPDGGDFDNDGDVDGNDFLKWQRCESPNGLTQTDLDAWKANYGPNGLPAVAAVPEPATSVLVMLAAASVGCIRGVGRSKRIATAS